MKGKEIAGKARYIAALGLAGCLLAGGSMQTCAATLKDAGEAQIPDLVGEERVCYEEKNTAYEYVVGTSYDPEEKTEGRVILTECRVSEPDETLEAVEGYEWSTAHLEVLFNDRNAWRYGSTYDFTFTDYYNLGQIADSYIPDGNSMQYTVNYNGREYPECRFTVRNIAVSQKRRYGVQCIMLDVAFRTPKGYDGVVMCFNDPALISDKLGTEGFDPASEGCLYIRLNPYMAQNTEYPRMAVINGCIPVQPGEVLESSTIIRTDMDNDNGEMGFFGFRKVGELRDFDVESFWASESVYMEEKLAEDTELLPILGILEEGVYEVTAAVRDQNGNAVTTLLTIIADGTAPEIHVPNETVTLGGGKVFYPGEDVYGVDNFWAQEDCLGYMDQEELNVLYMAAQIGRQGSYTLTYTFEDAAGNIGEKKITVNLTTGENKQQGSGQFMTDMAKAALDYVNVYRAAAGLEALVWDDTIYAAAQVRAQELAISFSHTRPDGSSCGTALSGSYNIAGENIALGYTSAAAVCDGWYNSPGHRANMLQGAFTKGAIACWYENGTFYWVNLFIG